MRQPPKGGSYLIESTAFENVFTPEDFSDEHRMVAETVSNFIRDKIFPVIEEIELKKKGLMRELLVEAGQLGLLGADIPEEYGGCDTDEISSLIIAEKVGATGSFAVGHGVHCCIGNLPIVFFGNQDQKSRYLPAIAEARMVSGYALTEPDSGSDALSAKSKAVLSDDGKYYILNGGKSFISNAGIADILIVYAKIDGEQFSAFIVDTHADGLTTGPEEKKMGFKGSSTRSVYFDNVKVPVADLLYKPGKGHEVAFNILNIGRHKVSANALGVAKYILDISAGYANERKQFKQPIAEFGMIREKLAEMATRIYAAESTLYRTGGLLMDMMQSLELKGEDAGQLTARGIGEYAIECSLEKVFVTEMEAFVVDEGVQIHGGYGYIAEYAVERLYRDVRVHRIFEGTNEINRILISTTLFRRGTRGSLPLMAAFEELKQSLHGNIPVREDTAGIVQGIKDVFLFVMGVSFEHYGQEIFQEQEILGRLADIAIHAYSSESCWLRAEKAAAVDGRRVQLKRDLASSFIYQTAEKTSFAALEIIASLESGKALLKMQKDLAALLQYIPVDIISLRQKIAATISASGKYVV